MLASHIKTTYGSRQIEGNRAVWGVQIAGTATEEKVVNFEVKFGEVIEDEDAHPNQGIELANRPGASGDEIGWEFLVISSDASTVLNGLIVVEWLNEWLDEGGVRPRNHRAGPKFGDWTMDQMEEEESG